MPWFYFIVFSSLVRASKVVAYNVFYPCCAESDRVLVAVWTVREEGSTFPQAPSRLLSKIEE